MIYESSFTFEKNKFVKIDSTSEGWEFKDYKEKDNLVRIKMSSGQIIATPDTFISLAATFSNLRRMDAINLQERIEQNYTIFKDKKEYSKIKTSILNRLRKISEFEDLSSFKDKSKELDSIALDLNKSLVTIFEDSVYSQQLLHLMKKIFFYKPLLKKYRIKCKEFDILSRIFQIIGILNDEPYGFYYYNYGNTMFWEDNMSWHLSEVSSCYKLKILNKIYLIEDFKKDISKVKRARKLIKPAKTKNGGASLLGCLWVKE